MKATLIIAFICAINPNGPTRQCDGYTEAVSYGSTCAQRAVTLRAELPASHKLVWWECKRG